MITGPSGSGKSDLALRLLDRGFALVSDDQTIVKRDGDRLLASPPPTIAGKLEIRGIGIVDMDHRSDVPVALIVELTQRHPAAARRQPGAAHSRRQAAADRDRCDDRIGAIQGRAGARSNGPQALMTSAASAATAARHRHVRSRQVDRPRCARGHGLGCRRQPPRRPARGFRPRRRPVPDHAGRHWHGRRAAAASTRTGLPA